jgi:hypothetical protein
MFQYIHGTPEGGYMLKHIVFVRMWYINTNCLLYVIYKYRLCWLFYCLLWSYLHDRTQLLKTQLNVFTAHKKSAKRPQTETTQRHWGCSGAMDPAATQEVLHGGDSLAGALTGCLLQHAWGLLLMPLFLHPEQSLNRVHLNKPLNNHLWNILFEGVI